MLNDLNAEVLRLILAGERQKATDMISDWAQRNSYEKVIMEIIEPVLYCFGKMWAEGDNISMGQGYVAGKVVEDIMEKADSIQLEKTTDASLKGPIIIGNIEDDSHALGRKMIVIFLKIDGWEVIDLGKDVLAKEFVDKAVEVNAPIVAVSAMMYRTAMNIKKLREEIDKRGLTDKIQLAVGGAVFIQRPELVKEVGGDGTAKNAIFVPDLMDRLIEKILSKGKNHE